MNRYAFESEFGPCLDTDPGGVVLTVNGQRTRNGQSPMFQGRLTNWGWEPDGEDWEGRAVALRIARQLQEVCTQTKLSWISEAQVPWWPVVIRVPVGGDLAERVRAGLGIASDEMAEVARLDSSDLDGIAPADHQCWQLFYFSDAALESLEAYFDPREIAGYSRLAKILEPLQMCGKVRFDVHERAQDQRYDVAPILAGGVTTEGYFVGVWAYEVRT